MYFLLQAKLGGWSPLSREGVSGTKLFLLPLAQDPLHRRTDCLIRAMNTSDPAARPAFAILQFRKRNVDSFRSRLWSLRIFHPTNKFIAGEGCDVFPGREGDRRTQQSI